MNNTKCDNSSHSIYNGAFIIRVKITNNIFNFPQKGDMRDWYQNSLQSDFYEDVPLSKQRSVHVSYDSDLESYDALGRHDKGSTSGKSVFRKAISENMATSLPKII